uniref:C-type lectin n=1 Tax=Littorina littorea TaxID=31216 RepID=A0A0A7RPR4_LITLI|nr:C-type lectin [Littorina littorea]
MFAQFTAVLTVLAVIRTGESAECPGGWTHYGGSCLVVLMDAVNWYEAKVACATVGGQLVEIANADENNFVSNLLKTHGVGYTWIGLEDFLVEGKFVWSSNGTPPAFTNFHAGQPDDNGHSADCAIIRDSGAWYDDHCRSTHPAVCQRAANLGGDEIVG